MDTMSIPDLARAGGFTSGSELRDLLLRVPLESPAQRDAYERWARDDGSKIGLLRLLGSG